MRHLASLLLVIILTIPVLGQAYQPEFEPVACPYFMRVLTDTYERELTCGYVHVPEDRNNVTGNQISLFTVRIHAIEQTDHAPIIFLEGGPGGSATAFVEQWLTSRLVQTYDLILVDQRGTGLSEPSLNCFEADTVGLEAIRFCYNRLTGDNLNLNMYNSKQNAHDIHDLVVALELEEVNLMGSSYGTRLALTILRDHPDRIRAVVLDAVYPPQVDSLVEQGYALNQVLEQLFTDCESDVDCRTAYPNLRDTFYGVVDRLTESPEQIYDFESGYLITMDGDELINFIFNLLYDSGTLPYLPALIDAYGRGNYQYDPQFEDEQMQLQADIDNNVIQPDDIDLFAMERLGFDTVKALYDYYLSLDDEALSALITELEDYLYYSPFLNYLGVDTIDDVIVYLDEVDKDQYTALETEVLGYYDDDSDGMYLSVECSEEIPFNTQDKIDAQHPEIPPQIRSAAIDFAKGSTTECSFWDVPLADAIETQPITSDVPALLLSGAYDPVTPAYWAEETANYLTHSYHYIFPNAGHGTLETQDCAIEIALHFLDAPQTTPDTSCLTQIGAPDFYVKIPTS